MIVSTMARQWGFAGQSVFSLSLSNYDNDLPVFVTRSRRDTERRNGVSTCVLKPSRLETNVSQPYLGP